MDALFLPKNSLPSQSELYQTAKKFRAVLANEEDSYRPRNSVSKPGSLIDFTGDSVPIIVIPDLHARPHFLKNILEYKINAESGILHTESDETVFSALGKGFLRIVFLGDALHTEKTTTKRWLAAMEDFFDGISTGDAMKEEMADGLSLLLMLMNLKIAFPKHFHFLKGNHENIRNVTGNGDYSFRKYAEEGRMVKDFMSEFYGNAVLYMISDCENLLPLVYAAPNCIVSHAEPFRAFTRDEVIDARLLNGVVEGLTWTDNDSAYEGSVDGMIGFLLPKSRGDDAVYIGGHRPVSGKFKLRQGGRYIQIHNPLNQNVAIVRPDRKFNPESDIVCVGLCEN